MPVVTRSQSKRAAMASLDGTPIGTPLDGTPIGTPVGTPIKSPSSFVETPVCDNESRKCAVVLRGTMEAILFQLVGDQVLGLQIVKIADCKFGGCTGWPSLSMPPFLAPYFVPDTIISLGYKKDWYQAMWAYDKNIALDLLKGRL